MESDGQAVRLDTISRQVAFADGAGGLPTMKIGFVFRGKLDVTAGAHKLSYFDNNFPGRAGWKEIVVLGDGVAILDSSAPGYRSQPGTDQLLQRSVEQPPTATIGSGRLQDFIL